MRTDAVLVMAIANEQPDDIEFPWELKDFEDFVERWRAHSLPATQVYIPLSFNYSCDLYLFSSLLYLSLNVRLPSFGSGFGWYILMRSLKHMPVCLIIYVTLLNLSWLII
jgi:hypothetical protein